PQSGIGMTASLSIRGAGEIRRVVYTARSLIFRDLRIRTQRTRSSHAALLVSILVELRGDDRARRLPLLHPLLQGAQHIEDVRAFSVAAMRHARDHVEPQGIVGLRC